MGRAEREGHEGFPSESARERGGRVGHLGLAPQVRGQLSQVNSLSRGIGRHKESLTHYQSQLLSPCPSVFGMNTLKR